MTRLPSRRQVVMRRFWMAGSSVNGQKQYYKNDNLEDYTNGTAQANATGYKLLPIKIGVSISYIFK